MKFLALGFVFLLGAAGDGSGCSKAAPTPPPEAASSDLDSGITGRVTLGPLCPVERVGKVCDKPLSAPVEVDHLDGTRVVVARSGGDGRFRIAVAPGDYLLVALPLHPRDFYPRGISQHVTVNPGGFTMIIVRYDTGIR